MESISTIDPANRTCTSLLAEIVRNPESPRWAEFDRTYRKIILAIARRSGLDHHDAQDLTQDIFRELTFNLVGFSSTGRTGSFRRYLSNLVRWRVANRLKSRRRDPAAQALAAITPDDGAVHEPEHPSLPRDPGSDPDFREAVTQAMLALSRDLPPRDLQLLDLYFCQNWPAADVARSLGISRANVFTIAHRHKFRLVREILRWL